MSSGAAFVPLRDQEIDALYQDLDQDQDGNVSFDELERKLHAVHEEIAPRPLKHHLHHPSRRGKSEKHHPEKHASGDASSDLHDFLCSLMPGCGRSMSKEQFFNAVRSWNIPSQDQTTTETEEDEAKQYDHQLPLGRRLAAWWSVKGPEIAFLVFVFCLIMGFSFWQGFIYVTSGSARAALGGGVIAAKFSAGAVYPTFFFLILSMSRWFGTLCRKSYQVSRFINWDRSQSFHIRISILAFVLSMTHVIGHLSGTLSYASSSNRQRQLQNYFGPDYVPRTYAEYV